MSLFKFFIHFLLFLFGNKFIGNLLCDYDLINLDTWTIYGSIDNFNIAFPDTAASYRGSFICVKKEETINLESHIPNARYYSIQVYDSTTASLGSLNDFQIETINGKFSVNITRTKNSFSFGNTLHVTTPDSLLVLLYRVYDVPGTTELTKLNISTNGKIESFGWIETPTLYKYDSNGNKINLIHAQNYTKIGFPNLFLNMKPLKESKYNNTKNNFFKPYSNKYFSNDDASYLISTISLHNTQNKVIGAIIKGYLPLVDINRTNYFKSSKSNYLYNNTCNNTCNNIFGYHEVRYVSFNMGSLSTPLPTIAGPMLKTFSTIIDSMTDSFVKQYVDPKEISSTGKPGIIDADIISRYGNTREWNNEGRPFTIYIGLNVHHIKKLGGNPDTDLYLTYPTHYITGKPFSYPVIVFRHLMSQHKFMTNPIFKHSIDSINKSFASPSECQQIMQKYYPTIDFLYV